MNKATTPVADGDVEDDGEASGLESDQGPVYDESDDSGSEFIEEDADSVLGDDSEEGEAIMLAAAVEASLQTEMTGVASSSLSRLPCINSAAAKCAAAAERRLGKDFDVDDFTMNVDSGSESEAPLAKAGKGKAKAKGKAPHTVKKKHMTPAEMRKQQKEERKAAIAARRHNKAEELELRRKLGRKLTPVSSLFFYRNGVTSMSTFWAGREDCTRFEQTPSRAQGYLG